MRSSKKAEVSLKSSAQKLTDHKIGSDLAAAWKSLSQSKAALRHIENHLEAVPGTGVVLDSVMNPIKEKSSQIIHSRNGIQAKNGGSSKHRRSRQSPEKSSSRSPLRNATQDSNVCRNNGVEFRDRLASYRSAPPPSHPSSQLEMLSQSVPESSNSSSDPLLSQMVYQRDTRDKQTDRDLDSTHSSALMSTEVRYLNDLPALDTLKNNGYQSPLTIDRVPVREWNEDNRTPKAQVDIIQHSSPYFASVPGSLPRGEGTPSSSPGSASQRLENLRRHQPDDKLEKLKERIRRQRKHLEEAAGRSKLLGFQEQPITAAVETNKSAPAVKIRKVAPAPPAPIYRGFNSTETKIRTPDGKVWKEEEFHNLSREIYRDLTQQFAELTKSNHQQQKEQRAEMSKEKRPSKPVRKVHKAAAASDLNAKPAGISAASWRDGQKLVKMVLGPLPKPSRETDRSPQVDGPIETASRHRSGSGPHLKSKHRSHPHSKERPLSGFKEQLNGHCAAGSTLPQENPSLGVSKDLLSADIQGILDDLQLDYESTERVERARQRSRCESRGKRGRGGSGSRTRTPISAWGTTVVTRSSSRGCRSASPTTNRSEMVNVADAGSKKRHYDPNAIRQYIVQQKEDRKRRQEEEKRALREETEKRNHRLQELYRKQKEVARTVVVPSEIPVPSVQKHLQMTYNKLLQEESQLSKEATLMHSNAPFSEMRPMYQPSGESDKENLRLDAPQSPSSSDRSLNEQPPPLSRIDLDGGVDSLLPSDYLSPAVRPKTAPSSHLPTPVGDHLLSQLLRLETAMAAAEVRRHEPPATVPTNRSHSKMSRIEALKATAASLSNRIESEARKIAGEGINYGTTTATDMDGILAPPLSTTNLENGCWPETSVTENNNNAGRNTQRILNGTVHSLYDTTVLPGVGNLHAFGGKKELMNTHIISTSPQTSHGDVPRPNLSSTQEHRKLVNGLEKEELKYMKDKSKRDDNAETQVEHHDSSAGSISEGPILSEGSFSEDEAHPPLHTINRAFTPVNGVQAVDYCAGRGQQKDFQRLSEFQREAAKCSALASTFALQDNSNAAWEELNKGSPLSVINIFTRNLNKHGKVNGINSPSAQSFHSGNGLGDAPVYEDDFVSPQSSRTTSQSRKSPSVNSHFEELMRRSPYDKSSEGVNSHRSSFQSPVHSQHLSSDSLSVSSPRSKHSGRNKGAVSDRSDVTLVEEQRSPCSPLSEVLSSDSRKRGSDRSSSHSKAKSVHSSDTLAESLNRSHHSLGRDGRKSPTVTPKQASPLASSISGSPPGEASPSDFVRGDNKNTGTSTRNIREETGNMGDLHYSPAVLQQRMAAELQYLESIEESVRQLDNMERLMSVTMAQQETTSLAQLLKAKQQRHEHDLYELQIKAEREALEAKLQLEENRQRMTRAHIELREKLAGSQKETLEGLQEATTKMMSQQAEAAQHTADAARHIKEMTELARTQIAGALVVAPAANKSMSERREEQERDLQPNQVLSDSFQSEVSSRQARPDDPPSSLNSFSHSDSLSFKRPGLSETNSSSHNSPSYSSAHRDRRNMEAGKEKGRKGRAEGRTEREGGSSSIEEEAATAANDSLCSESIPFVRDEKGDSTSVATEYSLKFDESMTEDEIEERSFRSLLPSEAHRRGTMEKKSQPREGSEDDHVSHSTFIPGANNILKPLDASMSFSGGQDSFSQFTMDMVRQYMKDEEVRLQHQSSLLRLRQKAVREKTKTELAWLEHQKKRLRDKGEDDKMPPIRKKQRGLLLKLQQEQAEIKRLQEANKAARKERQLLLKQQEEIERMRTTTLRLKERLKCAGGEVPPELLASETPVSEPVSPNRERHVDENRSPSPSLSVSGSETSSIMQKLKKMRTQMDEKFLTKREQQLMQRRHHAEELLQWKQRLDQEEAEVRRMEKEALAVWNKRTPQDLARDVSQSPKNDISDLSFQQSSGLQNHSEKEFVSEGDISSATESSIHTEEFGSGQPGSPSSLKPVSVIETPLASVKSSPENYSQDFTSVSPPPSRQSSILKGSRSPAASPSDGSSKTKMQIHSSSRTAVQTHIRPQDLPQAVQKEAISDQSDIESRINALKEELRKRKCLAYQLKKEQKKRQKERLKAKEASLLRELENCNSFIEKTKAELSKGTDQISDVKSQVQDSTSDPQQSRIKSHDHRSEKRQVSESEESNVDALSDHKFHPEVDRSESASLPDLSDEDPPTVTQTPVNGSPDCLVSERKSHHTSEELVRPSSISNKIIVAEDDNIVSDQTSEIQEDLERELSSRLDEHNSECLLKLEGENRSDVHVKHVPHSESEILTPSKAEDVSNLELKSLSVPVDCKSSTHPSSSSPSSTSSCEPDSVANSLKKEVPMKGTENVFSLTGDCYEDLKASVDLPPSDQHFSSKEKSHFTLYQTEIKDLNKDSFWLQNNSQGENLGEDRAVEPGQQSVISESSHQSVGSVDLHEQTDDFKHDCKSIHSSHSPPLSAVRDEMAEFNIGDRVLVGSVQPGTLRFKGPTSFANGFWAGVELDKSEGSNNGTYDGVVYFKCNDRHGIFAPPEKITQLPEKFEAYADTTEDEDSVTDDLSDKVRDKCQTDEEKKLNQENLECNHFDTALNNFGSSGVSPHTVHKLDREDTSQLHSQNQEEPKPLSNGSSQDIMLDLESSEIVLGKQNKSQITLHVEKVDLEVTPEFTPTEASVTKDVEEKGEPDKLDTFTDKLLKSFIADAVEKFAEIKKAKVEKIEAANKNNREPFCADLEEEWISSVEQKDGLPFFPPLEKEELSSPELCNRPESPVLGASGQEELAKRLAELELSRELLDDLCDDQDWFDEDFGLSSRREQQRLKQKQREEEEELRLGGFGGGSSISSAAMGGLVPSPGGEQHVKSPPRPELPLPLPPKLPEQPALVVPHSAKEVEKMVHAATQEIWERCGLAKEGAVTLAQMPNPEPSQEYLGKEASSEDEDALFIRSYKKGVYDLTWEILQEIYAEDPNANQPLWVKPRRVKASFHRIKTPGDIATVQAYVTAEVLKLYGLSKDHSQKTDWQKMLKFGRKKRDRVDHILVQELHEEESQWVNYDEDELSVKMQLADSILDALLKDTVNVLTLIYDKRTKTDAVS